jgi:hypothetical protein
VLVLQYTVSSIYEPSASSCLAEAWLGHLSYALAVGITLAKVWRVGKIYSSAKIQVVKLSNNNLFMRVGLAVVIVHLVVWSAAPTGQHRVHRLRERL